MPLSSKYNTYPKKDHDIKGNSFTLSQIGSWQLDASNLIVELPMLQGVLVWKVARIEALWDSFIKGISDRSFPSFEKR